MTQIPSKTYAEQLRAGKEILSQASHHLGMAELKSQLGSPRPPGLSGKRPLFTLSLTTADSASGYWGYAYRKGCKVPYRLSTDPADYSWESWGDNLSRKPPTARGRYGYQSIESIIGGGPADLKEWSDQSKLPFCANGHNVSGRGRPCNCT